MKRNSSIILFFAFILSLSAQIVKPVKWSAKTEKIAENEFNLIINAVIEKDWHVYSQFTPDGGPLPMELKFANAKGNFELVGKAKESEYKKQMNDVFGVEEYYFSNSFTITQKIKITNFNFSKAILNIDYQVCKDVCINDKISLNFNIPVEKKAIFEQNTSPILEKNDTLAVVQKSKEVVEKQEVKVVLQKTELKDKDLWSVFFLAFLGGLAALFTPCLFPMIPMTVSFFTKQNRSKTKGKIDAIFYGLSIIIIYVLLGLLITSIFGAGALNSIATNVWFNLIFFLLILIFAISFFGAFEIVLPNSFVNKIDQQSNRSGFVGILFMAMALAVVSFSCTGPIVGTLLVEFASKGGIAPVIGMLGFSSALALPFMFFALFPGWLSSLPRSGSWLNTVKVSLGFLELALALKFLSNADMVLQLHWLERELFIAIWIAIFAVWGIYLLGKLKLPHDGANDSISVGRLLIALLVLSFTIYLIPGLFGAPLQLINAFPPPQNYSENHANGIFQSKSVAVALPNGAEYGPHGIIAFNDYQKGLDYAKKVNKPIMLDFTGYACVNCRKMENQVWSQPEVLSILKEKIVLVSLYVDDKRKLSVNERFISKINGNEITTIGEKWTDFMISRYKTNTQPYYVLLDANEVKLNEPVSYTPDIEEYKKWLEDGILRFQER
jgi:thiol:disulfide interchange protein